MLLQRLNDNRGQRRGGFVIIAVLLVVAVLSLAAYQYSNLMDAEYLASDRIRKTTEARALADSGIHFAMAILADKGSFDGVLNSNPFDNAGSFQGVAVNESESPSAQGRFSLIAFDLSQVSTAQGSVPIRYGVTDETGKLNINALYALDTSGKVLHDALMKLPDMTDEFAWSIVDWIDPDEDENPGGAESQYYSSRTPSYQCKNAPFDTIEELLLVKGITPSLLYGTDRNRNGKVDPGEDDSNGFKPGWINYLTVYSRERNVDGDGNPRVNVNGNDATQLLNDLTTAVGAELANFIVAYRMYGSTTMMMGGNVQNGNNAALTNLVQSGIQSNRQMSQRVSSLFSLVTATFTVQAQGGQGGGNGKGGNQTSTRYSSPIANIASSTDTLTKLFDKCTTSAEMELPAKVNVLTAPREVLLALPGITEADADSLISKRPTYANGEAPDANTASLGWLASSSGIAPTTLASLERFVTARSQVYRVVSVGYFDQGGPKVRVEAIIDTNQGKPRIVYYRELTDLGGTIDPRVSR